MNKINLKDKEIQQRILNKNPSWRFGIQPSGGLARSPYLSQLYQPSFSKIRQPKEGHIKIICDTKWTRNLIESSVYDKRDGVSMNSLSVTQSLIKSEEMKSQYQIDYKSFLLIDISSSESITDEVNKKLVVIMDQYSSNKNDKVAWESLHTLFEEYGFLWPEGIVVGYKQSTHLENLSPSETLNREYNSIDLSQELFTDDSIEKLTIVKRKSLKPIYEFMPSNLKKFILNIFKNKIHDLKLETPVRWDQKFKLKNIHSKRYLNRHEHVNEEYEPSMCSDHSDVHCIWSFQRPTLYHREFSEVLQGSEDVFLCSPKFQVPDIEHLVITSEGPENDSCGIHHVHLSMDFHEKTNTWLLETINIKKSKQVYPNESLDDAINNFECILNGDEIKLKQSEVYLSTNEPMLGSSSFRVGVRAIKRALRDEKLPKHKKGRDLKTYKSCVLPPKTNDKGCTHLAHCCASQLMVKEKCFPHSTECSWKIEIINDKIHQSINHSNKLESTDTSCNSEFLADPNQENQLQENTIQSNLDSSSQPDSMLAIISHQDQYSQTNCKPSENSIVQVNDSGSETMNRNRNYADEYLRKNSDSDLHSRSNSLSSFSSSYIDEGAYIQEHPAKENQSIKTQKKRKRLLLRLGKNNIKKNTLVTFLKKVTLVSYVPSISKLSFKEPKPSKSST